MYAYLKNNLLAYESFCVGRDENGEATPVFIKKTFEIVESHTIWLTDTPLIESSIESSKHSRIATYIVFKNQQNQAIAFFNTNLDFTGDETTYKQSIHLQNYIDLIKEKYNARIVICGDFNSHPETKTIRYFEAKYKTSFNKKDDNQLTYHGYSEEKKGTPIDYFFVDKQMNIKNSNIIYNNKNTFLSDHYPIEVSLIY